MAAATSSPDRRRWRRGLQAAARGGQRRGCRRPTWPRPSAGRSRSGALEDVEVKRAWASRPICDLACSPADLGPAGLVHPEPRRPVAPPSPTRSTCRTDPAVELVPGPDRSPSSIAPAPLRAAGPGADPLKCEINGRQPLQSAVLAEAPPVADDLCEVGTSTPPWRRPRPARFFMGPFETIDLNAPAASPITHPARPDVPRAGLGTGRRPPLGRRSRRQDRRRGGREPRTRSERAHGATNARRLVAAKRPALRR